MRGVPSICICGGPTFICIGLMLILICLSGDPEAEMEPGRGVDSGVPGAGLLVFCMGGGMSEEIMEARMAPN